MLSKADSIGKQLVKNLDESLLIRINFNLLIADFLINLELYVPLLKGTFDTINQNLNGLSHIELIYLQHELFHHDLIVISNICEDEIQQITVYLQRPEITISYV